MLAVIVAVCGVQFGNLHLKCNSQQSMHLKRNDLFQASLCQAPLLMLQMVPCLPFPHRYLRRLHHCCRYFVLSN